MRGLMDSSIRSRTLILRLLSALMVLAFALQVKKQVQKFLAGARTTTVVNREERPIPFPSVTFCPGYRREILEEAGFPLIQVRNG